MKKKVLFAIPTLGGGGAEKVLVTLINNLDFNKYDITLFSIFDEGINRNYLNEKIIYKYYYRKIFRGNIHFLKLFSPGYLYRKMINEEFDIVISYLEGPMTRIIGGYPYAKTKLVNWVHTEIHDFKVLSRSYRNLSETIEIQNKFDTTVFVSNSAREAFNKTFKNINNDFLVMYNTIDSNSVFVQSQNEVSDIVFRKDQIKLISVGRYTKVKGYERLLRIIKLLVNENFPLHLYLIGSGKLEKKYFSLIKELELEENVTILGYKENPHKYVERCDLFICSSFQEGFSTAVTESILVGTPVITTACSGMEEILGTNNEFGLITKNDTNSLYQGLKRIITEPNLLQHYKEKAERRSNFFNVNHSVENIEKFLDQEVN